MTYTAKERKYLARLMHRLSVLAARLEATPGDASFRVEIQKEYNAMKWAVERLEKPMSETAEAREKELRSRLDCGDNSCRYATTKGGMRTNGGCRCTRSTVMAQYVPLLETSLAAERQRADERWTLVTDSLPDKPGWYACTVNDDDGFQNLVEPWWWEPDEEGGGWREGDLSKMGKFTRVIAWMPLPKPYLAAVDERQK
jgi:hypothetical protein